MHWDSGTESWQGRNSLWVGDPLAKKDVPIPDNVRLYYFSSTQHGPDGQTRSRHVSATDQSAFLHGNPARLDRCLATPGSAKTFRRRPRAIHEFPTERWYRRSRQSKAFPMSRECAILADPTICRSMMAPFSQPTMSKARNIRCSFPKSTKTATRSPASARSLCKCRLRPMPDGTWGRKDLSKTNFVI